MKTTKEFVKQFNLDVENHQFNREDFLLELNKYFLELLYKTVSNKPLPNDSFKPENYKKWLYDNSDKTHLSFYLFKRCVEQTEKKFWAISNKKAGLPFTKNLWGAFYAIYVVPCRANLFPSIEQEISVKREKRLKSQEGQD